MAVDAKTSAVPTIAAGAGISQQRKKAATIPTGSIERLRLSAIFPSPTGGTRPCSPRDRDDPGEELPIAASPAMLAFRRDVIAGGKFLDQLDIGSEPSTGKDAFEEIVTEKRVLRHAAS